MHVYTPKKIQPYSIYLHFNWCIIRSVHPVATLETIVELFINHNTRVWRATQSKAFPHKHSKRPAAKETKVSSLTTTQLDEKCILSYVPMIHMIYMHDIICSHDTYEIYTWYYMFPWYIWYICMISYVPMIRMRYIHDIICSHDTYDIYTWYYMFPWYIWYIYMILYLPMIHMRYIRDIICSHDTYEIYTWYYMFPWYIWYIYMTLCGLKDSIDCGFIDQLQQIGFQKFPTITHFNRTHCFFKSSNLRKVNITQRSVQVLYIIVSSFEFTIIKLF